MVGPPLWKIWVRQLGWGQQPNINGKMPNWWQPNMIIPNIYGKIIHWWQPKHQAEYHLMQMDRRNEHISADLTVSPSRCCCQWIHFDTTGMLALKMANARWNNQQPDYFCVLWPQHPSFQVGCQRTWTGYVFLNFQVFTYFKGECRETQVNSLFA